MEGWHDVREAAEILGISAKTVYILCASRRLAHYRVGRLPGRGKIIITDEGIAAFLKAYEVPAVLPESSHGGGGSGKKRRRITPRRPAARPIRRHGFAGASCNPPGIRGGGPRQRPTPARRPVSDPPEELAGPEPATLQGPTRIEAAPAWALQAHLLTIGDLEARWRIAREVIMERTWQTPIPRDYGWLGYSPGIRFDIAEVEGWERNAELDLASVLASIPRANGFAPAKEDLSPWDGNSPVPWGRLLTVDDLVVRWRTTRRLVLRRLRRSNIKVIRFGSWWTPKLRFRLEAVMAWEESAERPAAPMLGGEGAGKGSMPAPLPPPKGERPIAIDDNPFGGVSSSTAAANPRRFW